MRIPDGLLDMGTSIGVGSGGREDRVGVRGVFILMDGVPEWSAGCCCKSFLRRIYRLAKASSKALSRCLRMCILN